MPVPSKNVEDNQLENILKELTDVKYAIDQSSIVAITDHQGKILYVNEKFCKISKYNEEELLGEDHCILNSGYHSREFLNKCGQRLVPVKSGRER